MRWTDWGHVALGAGTALLPTGMMLTAAGGYIAYQWAGWVKKGDRVAFDLKTWLVGYCLGIAAQWVYVCDSLPGWMVFWEGC